MIVIPCHKLLYIHIHKNAGKSVRSDLKRLAVNTCAASDGPVYFNKEWAGEVVSGHATMQGVIERFPELQQYRKFSFVRNPWDRLASAYFWFKSKGLDRGGFNASHVKSYEDFDSFVRALHRSWKAMISQEGKDVGFRCSSAIKVNGKRIIYPSQCAYLYDCDGQRLYDDVGYVERLDRDFSRIVTTAVGQDAAKHLSIKRIGSSGKRDYRELYTDETREMVGEVYACDIEAFGYTFDNEGLPPPVGS